MKHQLFHTSLQDHHGQWLSVNSHHHLKMMILSYKMFALKIRILVKAEQRTFCCLTSGICSNNVDSVCGNKEGGCFQSTKCKSTVLETSDHTFCIALVYIHSFHLLSFLRPQSFCFGAISDTSSSNFLGFAQKHGRVKGD